MDFEQEQELIAQIKKYVTENLPLSKMSDEELKRSVSDAISRIDPNYFAVITIDRL